MASGSIDKGWSEMHNRDEFALIIVLSITTRLTSHLPSGGAFSYWL